MRDDPSWSEWEKTLASFYHQLNYGNHGAGWLMGAGHKALEDLVEPGASFPFVVEVGAGTGEHLHYVQHPFGNYCMLDRSPAMLEIAKGRYRDDGRNLSFEVGEVEKLPFEDGSADRLVATHVLEHVYRPHDVLREWNRVLKPGGILSVLIPTDPGVAWRIGRAVGTRRAVTKRGLPYDYFMALEHVNPVNNLVALLEFYFPDAKKVWWPFRIGSMDLNFFYAFHAIKPR
jgi:ubiquinone/menaquinone biosynthesis C-methylase UbiE